jgi:hypothetical protein
MINDSVKLTLLCIVLLLVQRGDSKILKKPKISQNEEYIYIPRKNACSSLEESWYQLRNIDTNLCLSWSSDKSVTQIACNKNQKNQFWKVTKNIEKGSRWIKISNINGDFLENQGGDSKRLSKYGVSKENQSDV